LLVIVHWWNMKLAVIRVPWLILQLYDTAGGIHTLLHLTSSCHWEL